MKNYNKYIGNYGEYLSENYLKENKYIILSKNFRCRNGEIDIICLKDDILCFIEVKSRFNNLFGTPLEAITCYKKNKIIKVANYFIYSNNFFDYYVRFDVIEVFFNTQNTSWTLNHIKDAFRL